MSPRKGAWIIYETAGRGRRWQWRSYRRLYYALSEPNGILRSKSSFTAGTSLFDVSPRRMQRERINQDTRLEEFYLGIRKRTLMPSLVLIGSLIHAERTARTASNHSNISTLSILRTKVSNSYRFLCFVARCVHTVATRVAPWNGRECIIIRGSSRRLQVCRGYLCKFVFLWI